MSHGVDDECCGLLLLLIVVILENVGSKRDEGLRVMV